jgi:hypothetical protein
MSFDPLLKSERYDKYVAFELYLLYVEVEDAPTLNDAWLAVVPLVGMLLKREFNRLDDSMLEEFEADAIAEIREILRRKMPPINSAESFDWYTYSAVFKHTCELLEYEIRPLKANPNVACYERLTHIVSGEHIFTEVFTKHLPSYLLQTAVNKIRFAGRERDACEYLLERLAQGKNGSNGALRTRYDIPSERVPFFVNYATVLLRQSLYELRAE